MKNGVLNIQGCKSSNVYICKKLITFYTLP